VVDALQHDEAVAPAELKPKIGAVRRPLELYQHVLATGENQTIPLRDYRSMSIDLITTCSRHLPD